jgi:hypothetical protein
MLYYGLVTFIFTISFHLFLLSTTLSHEGGSLDRIYDRKCDSFRVLRRTETGSQATRECWGRQSFGPLSGPACPTVFWDESIFSVR